MARWYAMSTGFLTDPKVEILGEKHGPAGPLVMVALLARAKVQDNAGRAKVSVRTIAHESFVDRADVGRIVTDAAETGLLNIETQDDREVSVLFPAWSRWQDAGRKAREREASKQADVRTCPDPSVDVPTDRQTEQDRTEQLVDGGAADPPLCQLLADSIEKNTGRRPTVGKKWRDAERLLLERDKRDPVQAERLLRWSQNDEFWRGVVLSMPKFRAQYDQLLLHAKRGQQGKREEQADQRAQDEAWVREHLPDVPMPLALGALSTVRLSRTEVTPEKVRARLGPQGRVAA